jgi:hypothetical protein
MGVLTGNLDPGRLATDITSLFSSSYDTTHAAGGKIIDTTTFPNGVHTIFWVVSDTGGQSDGIGSRFFTISNGSLFVAPPSGIAGKATNTMVIAARSTLDTPTAGLEGGRTLDRAIADAPGNPRAILGRRGFDLGRALQTYEKASGRIDVQAEELDRVELHLSDTSNHHYGGT